MVIELEVHDQLPEPIYQFYQLEIAALQQLQQAKSGSFILENPSGSGRPLLEGRFRNGNPTEKWKVYDLYDSSNPDLPVQFQIRSNTVSKIRWIKKTLLPASQRYVISWRYRNLGL